MVTRFGWFPVFLLLLAPAAWASAPPAPDESPAAPNEWGFRPAEGSVSERTPPSFTWRPQPGAVRYQVEVARDRDFTDLVHRSSGVTYPVHCPSETFPSGVFYWRFRYSDEEIRVSPWSQTRRFSIAVNAVPFPLPGMAELVSRIPDSHPRLFVRPEQIRPLRDAAKRELREPFARLEALAAAALENPPPSHEPPKYPEGTERLSDEWRAIWWGNRTHTVNLLERASQLGLLWQIHRKRDHGDLAKRLLLDAAAWDPAGSTSYRYNSEAGMPFIYHFSRTYTFVQDLLTEEERELCREVIRVRGREIYGVLNPTHLANPFGSHRNRAWHFLGEAAIVFIDEIEEAPEWLWLAMNIFANLYPVWGDDDGGWHEGLAYWRSYLARFSWWADAMRVSLGLNAYDLPFFSEVGYYPIYLQPPGSSVDGFGDSTNNLPSSRNVPLMQIFATQAGNGHWQWYVDAHGGAPEGGAFFQIIRGNITPASPVPPVDLPSSRLFRGIGQAYLNTDLTDAANNVQVLFKSSPMGTQSHGYEAQNAFKFSAWGQRLLITTGQRDLYGSPHHRDWMWHTRSVNSVTVDGESQFRRNARAVGEITAFHTSEDFDFVAGEAGGAYPENLLNGFRRSLLFAKPDTLVILDRLEADEPRSFTWHFHAPVPFEGNKQEALTIQNNGVSARLSLLYPPGLEWTQTDQFEPPPHPRIQLVEHHLDVKPAEPAREARMVAVARAFRGEIPDAEPAPRVVERKDGGFIVTVREADGTSLQVFWDGDQRVAARRLDADGNPAAAFDSRQIKE